MLKTRNMAYDNGLDLGLRSGLEFAISTRCDNVDHRGFKSSVLGVSQFLLLGDVCQREQRLYGSDRCRWSKVKGGRQVIHRARCILI